MKEIVFASCNQKKKAEIQRMAPSNIKILGLNDIENAKGVEQVEETGKTFMENALIKARYWAKKLKMPVIAEDSGIEINALDGYPGIYTKRCIEQLCPGENVDSDKPEELYPMLLKLIDESKTKSKTAHWVSAISYVDGEKEICKQESISGKMCSCRGDRKFGFDQYFEPEGENKTLSELLPEEKDEIGPRKKAFLEVLEKIK